jgi:hypothetical protein
MTSIGNGQRGSRELSSSCNKTAVLSDSCEKNPVFKVGQSSYSRISGTLLAQNP